MKRIFALISMAIIISMASFAQSKAAYPKGDKAMNEFITKTMVYPVAAKENSVEGTVVLTIVVKADGSIGNVKVNRMIDPDLEAEAIRIVRKMPKWTPATNADGKAIESPTTISVKFKLPE